MQNGGVGHVTSDRLDTEGTKPGSDSIGTRERPDVALAHQQRGHDRCTKTIACGVAQVADVLVTGDVKYEVARHHPSREPSRSASYPSTADSYLRAAWSVTGEGNAAMLGLDRRASLPLGLLTDYSRLREHGFLAHPSLRMVVKDGPGLLAAYVDWGARERECILHGYRVDRCAEERCEDSALASGGVAGSCRD